MVKFSLLKGDIENSETFTAVNNILYTVYVLLSLFALQLPVTFCAVGIALFNVHSLLGGCPFFCHLLKEP